LGRVFPTVHVRSRNEMNHLLLAFAEERSLSDLQAALDAAPSAVADIAREVSRAVGPATYGQNATVFTDDRAPVERLTGRMMQTARAAGMLPER